MQWRGCAAALAAAVVLLARPAVPNESPPGPGDARRPPEAPRAAGGAGPEAEGAGGPAGPPQPAGVLHRSFMPAASPAVPARRATGLDRPFPPRRGERPTPERVELGRLLFFDPVLSADGSLSCAHCHRPERAFTDGRRTARGMGGARLGRNTPTLYNVAFKQRVFWDRRAASLEEQARGPLFADDEMGADPERLLGRLRSIEAYRGRFRRAFPEAGGDPVTLRNLTRALAAFERTLVSRSSRYDRYARGDRNALSPSERRGLKVFRSVNTRCFECHRLPTFDAPLAVGVGVPSDDPGVGGATGNPALRGAFGVPTLRNVARTAPYMHDGSLETLEDVVEFYRRGGGRALGVEPARIHEHVRPFEIRDEEAADLVAFLRALTDESARPETPERAPSGLPVLAPRPSVGAASALQRAERAPDAVAAPARDEAAVVRIQGMRYEPRHISVRKGGTVTWVNEDAVFHTVTSGEGTTPTRMPLDSPFLARGETFTHTFDTPGRYEYLCLPHLDQEPMRGATVTVSE